MKIDIRPATLSDVPSVANDLLEAGIADLNRAGSQPILLMGYDITHDECYLASTEEGKPLCMFGISNSGCIWLHMTHEVQKYPIAFIRAAKRFIDKLERPILYNWIDIQNTNLIKFVKHLGFKVINVVALEPKNNYHVEIVKLWHGWPPSRQEPV